ncbi:cysteine-rich tail protein 1 [Xenopus tropicalis]|uniref:Cysteine-rich tail protein 1 n=1 Tax=Xenopus tropicalis TaxID=8364 RepID=A0A8J1IM07_XENTR|nr:cysteine-rich tail protein 1 [Xenopus tropicalis]
MIPGNNLQLVFLILCGLGISRTGGESEQRISCPLMMDKGGSVQNPYASVNIPRAQLKSSFVRRTLGEGDLDGVVIANPAAVPSYPSYSPQDRYSGDVTSPAPWEGNKVRTQESWRRPYNPYADPPHNGGGHPPGMYAVDLDKRNKGAARAEEEPCCCYPCCKCCPCCRKNCCVVS